MNCRDRKRKKFVGDSGKDTPRTKRIKTESGHWIRASYKSSAYKEWKEKHKIGSSLGGWEEEGEEGQGVVGRGQKRGTPRRWHKKESKGSMDGGRGKRGRSSVADLKPRAAILKKRQKKELAEQRKRLNRTKKQNTAGGGGRGGGGRSFRTKRKK